jgi:CheY-like chemotaxis protein
MKILFLDDDVTVRHALFKGHCGTHEVTYVTTVDEAINALDTSPRFDLIYLDHDLEDRVFVPPGPDTGYWVARHITKMPKSKHPSEVIVHSWNESAALKMLDLLSDNGIKCKHRFFPRTSSFLMDFFTELNSHGC